MGNSFSEKGGGRGGGCDRDRGFEYEYNNANLKTYVGTYISLLGFGG